MCQEIHIAYILVYLYLCRPVCRYVHRHMYRDVWGRVHSHVYGHGYSRMYRSPDMQVDLPIHMYSLTCVYVYTHVRKHLHSMSAGRYVDMCIQNSTSVALGFGQLQLGILGLQAVALQ